MPRKQTSAKMPEADATTALLGDVLQLIGRSETRLDFLRGAARMMLAKLNLSAVEIRVCEARAYYRCIATVDDPANVDWAIVPYAKRGELQPVPAQPGASAWEDFLASVFSGDQPPVSVPRASVDPQYTKDAADASKVLVVRLAGDGRRLGLLAMTAHEGRFAPAAETRLAALADIVAIALTHQRATVAWRERVKEITCLYDIARIFRHAERPLSDLLADVVERVAPAWRYAEVASCRIRLDDREVRARNFRDGVDVLRAPILPGGIERGAIEVVYTEARPERDEGPFLDEERKLIDNLAQQIGSFVEERELAEQRAVLEHSLRHADRLATVGQFAAGVAHEINEPLAAILGFAQLALKETGLGEQPRHDIERIQGAALHAREIVRKLLFFSRQMPPHRGPIDLNRGVAQVLDVLGGRLRGGNVEVAVNLADDLPEIHGDHGQLTQVMVNLIVNALQAMPEGGKLTIETAAETDGVALTVADTGVGMDAATQEKVFLPFFTTKNVGEGTGMGLAVVHGIVNAHQGTIELASEPGVGTRFIVRLPRGEIEETR